MTNRYIAANKKGDVIQYHCWLYNATTKEFDYSTMLSTLTNISIDAENHNVLSRISSNGGDKIICYKWVDGSLRVDSQYTVGDDSIPEEVTQAALNNVIGQNQTASNSKPVTQKETDKAEPEKETTTKKDKDNGSNTTTKKPDKNQDETKKPTSANNDKETEAPSTTKENKPLYTTTTAPYDGGVLIETDVDIDEGWF